MSDLLKKPNSKKEVKVSRNNLPLSCPSQDMRIWDSHPRVFLAIAKKGRISCPYCGTEYILID